MFGRKIEQMVLGAAVAFFAMGSVAQAELRCFGSGENTEDGEAWQAICAGNEAAYADIQVMPSGEETGTVSVHVTDHLDCSGDQHLECGVASSIDGNFECFTEEDSRDFDYEGFISNVYVFCGCYEPGITCHGEE